MVFLYALLSQKLHFDQYLWVVSSKHWCGVRLYPPNIGTLISSSHLTAWTQPSTKTTNPVTLRPCRSEHQHHDRWHGGLGGAHQDKAGGQQSPTRQPAWPQEPEAAKLPSHCWISKGEQASCDSAVKAAAEPGRVSQTCNPDNSSVCFCRLINTTAIATRAGIEDAGLRVLNLMLFLLKLFCLFWMINTDRKERQNLKNGLNVAENIYIFHL